MPSRFTRAFLLLAAPVLLACGCGLGGCNILGPAYYFAVGPDKVPAQYQLDQTKSVVIFIDDRVPRTNRAEREIIGSSAEAALLEAKAVKDIIGSRAVQAVLIRERNGKAMGMAEVGKSVSADVVIYAALDNFSLTLDGQSYMPTAALRIKVIDANTKERLFPPPDAEPWCPLNIQLPGQQGFVPKRGSPQEAKARQELSRVVGVALARLFFEHEQPGPPQRLDRDSS